MTHWHVLRRMPIILLKGNFVSLMNNRMVMAFQDLGASGVWSKVGVRGDQYYWKGYWYPSFTNHCTVILKRPLFWDFSFYELNSIKIACKSVILIKSKLIPIVFIWLKEGPLWPTSVHAQGPQLFVSKPKWHAPSIVVKKYYGGVPIQTFVSECYLKTRRWKQQHV